MEASTLAELAGLADVWSTGETTVFQWLQKYFDAQKDIEVSRRSSHVPCILGCC